MRNVYVQVTKIVTDNDGLVSSEIIHTKQLFDEQLDGDDIEQLESLVDDANEEVPS